MKYIEALTYVALSVVAAAMIGAFAAGLLHYIGGASEDAANAFGNILATVHLVAFVATGRPMNGERV